MNDTEPKFEPEPVRNFIDRARGFLEQMKKGINVINREKP
jgi:hypothetical protein